MQTPQRRAPNLLLILLGPILLAVDWVAMESQGEETTVIIAPCGWDISSTVWADKWTRRESQAGNLNLGKGECVFVFED